ncbi:DUF6194 family protein [Curvivirga aplysinae]|uniref:DUF6194 family protein n=1 Tax=Curvivirga aplysinae TaxID=2529852 RepID=UPI0012BB614D|nr:DUF6194 family protein [Curvivirga aplysinae]MTI09546.1 hypothetical protein [Curvivirga aplysinae]
MPSDQLNDKQSLTASIEDIVDYMLSTYEGLVLSENWGERALFYNPGSKLPKGVYVLSFKERDGENDRASELNRGNLYRLNIGVGPKSFAARFGSKPLRPSAGGVVETGHDFTQINTIMPHPVYGWMNWIGVINPTHETFDGLKQEIEGAVIIAKKKFQQGK